MRNIVFTEMYSVLRKAPLPINYHELWFLQVIWAILHTLHFSPVWHLVKTLQPNKNFDRGLS